MDRSSIWRSGFTVILPAILLACILAIVFGQELLDSSTPHYVQSYDPELPYFLNSLAIFKSEPYQYYDHPGTPVELIGTFIIGVMRPVVGVRSGAYISYLLERPQTFLLYAHALITVLSMITLIMISRFSLPIRKRSDIVQGAGIGVLFFVLIPSVSFSTLHIWSHNSFTYAFGTLLLFGLFLALVHDKHLSFQLSILLGIGAGALTAVQLYFFTWVIGMLVSVGIYAFLNSRRWRNVIILVCGVLVGSGLGFVISTLPILHRYRELSWWIKGIIFHQGLYGSGPAGITSFSLMIQNLRSLAGKTPLIYLASLLVLILLGVSARIYRTSLSRRPGWVALSIGLSIQLILTHGIILKHPQTVYLLSVAAILPFILALCVLAFRYGSKKADLGLTVLSVVILTGFVIGAYQAVASWKAKSSQLNNLKEEAEQVIDSVATNSLGPGDSILYCGGMEHHPNVWH
jgi:hypothetical protein